MTLATTNITNQTTYSYPTPPWTDIHPGKINSDHYSRGFKGEPGYWEMRSLKKAYPLVVKKMQFRRGDWALLVKDQWFYWAGGRLLPYKQLTNRTNYHAHSFYPYSIGPIKPRVITSNDLARIQHDALREQTQPLNRLPDFYNKLWDSYGKHSSYKVTKRVTFLGHKMTIHKYLAPHIRSMEKQILALAKKDKKVRVFLSGLRTISAWHYRVIKGTKTRSYHSYGLALDFIPQQAKGQDMYWRWTRNKVAKWWTTPNSKMWLPPDSLIQIFEQHGFTWGGKWLFFDTIHFEYRPEILIYNALKPNSK